MIIYLHGFNSSPQSTKAQQLRQFLENLRKGSEFACPQLPDRPNAAVATIETEMARHPPGSITLVGSSLGGYYATAIAEKYGVRAVLLNPAVDPHVGLRKYLGTQQSYPGAPQYELTEEHLREWENLYVDQVHPQHYLLLVETWDEVLDYRAAVRRYRGARQIVVQGGDHAMASFTEHLPLILDFAGIGQVR